MNKRIREFDSLRGLAALSVVFFHYLIVIPLFRSKEVAEDPFLLLIKNTPLRFFWAGQEAVIFFFILSGLVLALPFINQNHVLYKDFIIKRLVRIYIPYITVVCLSLILRFTLSKEGIEGLSDWFHYAWTTPVTSWTILNHVLLISSFNNWELNPVLWSLVHEMRISLIFPFLALLILNNRYWKVLGVIGCLSVSVFLIYRYNQFNNDYLLTLRFLPYFVIGFLLAQYMDVLKAYCMTLSKIQKIIVFVASLLLYTYTWWFFPQINVIHLYIFNEWATVIGASMIIVLSVGSNTLSKFLHNKILLWLGDISYSLYLIHSISILSISYLFYNGTNLILIIFVSLIVSLFISHLMYKYIEIPSIKLGKYLITADRENGKLLSKKVV